MSHPDPIYEWRNPLGYEERYAGVPPVPGKAVEEFAPLKPWPDPIDERLREIRGAVERKKELDAAWRREFTLRANYGGSDYLAVQAEMDEFKALHNPWEMLAFLLDQIDSLREENAVALAALINACHDGWADGTGALAHYLREALDATHRPPLSGET